MVLRRCRQLLGNEEEAFDAMQDVLVEALRHPDRLKLEIASSVMLRITTEVCLAQLRGRPLPPNGPHGEVLLRIPKSRQRRWGNGSQPTRWRARSTRPASGRTRRSSIAIRRLRSPLPSSADCTEPKPAMRLPAESVSRFDGAVATEAIRSIGVDPFSAPALPENLAAVELAVSKP